MGRACRIVTLILSVGCFGLAGCVADQSTTTVAAVSETPPPTLTVQDPGQVKYYPSDEPLRLGFEHFNRGDYGTSAKHFEAAVTKDPEYMLRGRLKEARQALLKAYEREPQNPTVVNNMLLLDSSARYIRRD